MNSVTLFFSGWQQATCVRSTYTATCIKLFLPPPDGEGRDGSDTEMLVYSSLYHLTCLLAREGLVVDRFIKCR